MENHRMKGAMVARRSALAPTRRQGTSFLHHRVTPLIMPADTSQQQWRPITRQKYEKTRTQVHASPSRRESSHTMSGWWRNPRNRPAGNPAWYRARSRRPHTSSGLFRPHSRQWHRGFDRDDLVDARPDSELMYRSVQDSMRPRFQAEDQSCSATSAINQRQIR